MGKKLSRKCPACGAQGSLMISGGTKITYYYECNECHLRTRDYKTITAAVASWEKDDPEYFFYRKD